MSYEAVLEERVFGQSFAFEKVCGVERQWL